MNTLNRGTSKKDARRTRRETKKTETFNLMARQLQDAKDRIIMLERKGEPQLSVLQEHKLQSQLNRAMTLHAKRDKLDEQRDIVDQQNADVIALKEERIYKLQESIGARDLVIETLEETKESYRLDASFQKQIAKHARNGIYLMAISVALWAIGVYFG